MDDKNEADVIFYDFIVFDGDISIWCVRVWLYLLTIRE